MPKPFKKKDRFGKKKYKRNSRGSKQQRLLPQQRDKLIFCVFKFHNDCEIIIEMLHIFCHIFLAQLTLPCEQLEANFKNFTRIKSLIPIYTLSNQRRKIALCSHICFHFTFFCCCEIEIASKSYRETMSKVYQILPKARCSTRC